MTMDQDPNLRRANVRLALILAAVALGILVLFIWTTAGGWL